jgi:hypothetical protein
MQDEETVAALEEFLFGLSCEEIAETRARLRRLCIGAVNREEVNAFLGHDGVYAPVAEGDPAPCMNFTWNGERPRVPARSQARRDPVEPWRNFTSPISWSRSASGLLK